ncbi:hypothetical protein, partial [Clostridium gasigenes]
DKAINNLIDSGWSGQASSIFFNVKFIMYKNSMEKCKNKLSFLITYIQKSDLLFSQREIEENKLANIL